MPFLALLGARGGRPGRVSVRAGGRRFAERRVNVLAAVFGTLPFFRASPRPPTSTPTERRPTASSRAASPARPAWGSKRQYWSNNVTGVLPWINALTPTRVSGVWLHEVNGLSFRDYQRNGMLRPDVVPAGGPEDADLAAVQYHQEFREQEVLVWQAFGTQVPVDGPVPGRDAPGCRLPTPSARPALSLHRRFGVLPVAGVKGRTAVHSRRF